MLHVLLASLYGLSLVLFAAVSAAAARAYRSLGLEELAAAAWGFGTLSASSALAAASLFSGDPRLAATLFTASSSTAAAGLAVVAVAAWRRADAMPVVAPLLLALAADVLAALAGGLAAARARGLARVGLALLASAHVGRAASVALAPGGDALLVLAASEAVRAAAAASLAVYHAGGVLGGLGEEEQG